MPQLRLCLLLWPEKPQPLSVFLLYGPVIYPGNGQVAAIDAPDLRQSKCPAGDYCLALSFFGAACVTWGDGVGLRYSARIKAASCVTAIE